MCSSWKQNGDWERPRRAGDGFREVLLAHLGGLHMLFNYFLPLSFRVIIHFAHYRGDCSDFLWEKHTSHAPGDLLWSMARVTYATSKQEL